MSTWKNLRNDQPETDTAKQPPVASDSPDEDVPAPQVTVTSLELDVDSEVDCDPYNRTGQFCVPVINKYEKE